MQYSFIIPALDEEKRISKLLEQFKALEKKDAEVIVADGGSRDKTVEIAKKNGARTFLNKRESQNIAKNRNLGARHARGKVLVFCDADTRFDNLQRLLQEVSKIFSDASVVGGTLSLAVFPEEMLLKDKIFGSFYNAFIRYSFRIKMPFCGGQCQIVRKSAFNRIKGYNEKMVHGEDSELFSRLQKLGKLHFFLGHTIYESPRRYRKYGYLWLGLKGFASMVSQYIFKKSLLKEWEKVE